MSNCLVCNKKQPMPRAKRPGQSPQLPRLFCNDVCRAIYDEKVLKLLTTQSNMFSQIIDLPVDTKTITIHVTLNVTI